MFGAAFFELSHEDNFTLYLFNADVIVFDTFEILLHFVQFVVVSGEECACACFGMFVQMLDNGPRNADAIVGRSASTKFVEQHK